MPGPRLRQATDGWTLVEVLIITAIIGILAAIELVNWGTSRRKAFDARAEHDLRNAATIEEGYYTHHEVYLPCTNCNGGSLPGFNPSPGVDVDIAVAGEAFVATAYHPQGTQTFTWDSSDGGMQ
jgi:Tfp pilus assembly protein PilE